MNTNIFKTLIISAALATGVVACEKGPKSDSNAAAKPAEAPAAADPAAAAAPAAAAPAAAAPAAAEGKTFGAPLQLTEKVSITKLLADPVAFKDQKVQVEGMITDVCPKRGCWFEMAGEGPGEKLRFKVQDGVMVFPMDAKGQRAVAEGVVSVTELTLEESREHAEYQAKEYGKEYDPASITKPTTVVQLDGTGAVLTANN